MNQEIPPSIPTIIGVLSEKLSILGWVGRMSFSNLAKCSQLPHFLMTYRACKAWSKMLNFEFTSTKIDFLPQTMKLCKFAKFEMSNFLFILRCSLIQEENLELSNF